MRYGMLSLLFLLCIVDLPCSGQVDRANLEGTVTDSSGGAVSGAPSVVDGVVYAGSFAHRIVGADAKSGRVLFRFPHGEYVPVSGSGKRLLLHGYSRLFAVEPV